MVCSTRGCPSHSGSGLVGSSSRPSTCLGLGELLRCCVLDPLDPSSVSGSGELLLMCVLALLGPSSASLYSCSDLVVLGSESGSRNVPCRGTVVSGARNVPCLDRAIVLLTLLTQGQQGRVSFVSGKGYFEMFGFRC